MADRRSMTDALSLSPETVSFIQGDIAPAFRVNQSQKRRSLVPNLKNSRPTAQGTPSANNVDGDGRIEATHGQAKSVSRLACPPDGPPTVGRLLVPVTTRLQLTTANALRRAFLEQKLKRAQPATQQDIVEAALQVWLLRHGYLTERNGQSGGLIDLSE